MRFFFYGTLTHGAGNPFAAALHARLGPGRRGSVRGRLFAIPLAGGWYPALVEAPHQQQVWGYVYETLPGFTDDDLARMDAYEGYDPHNPAASQYVRERMGIGLEDGTVVAAEAYFHLAPLPPDSEPIPFGDFAAWLAQTGRTAFAPGDARD